MEIWHKILFERPFKSLVIQRKMTLINLNKVIFYSNYNKFNNFNH